MINPILSLVRKIAVRITAACAAWLPVSQSATQTVDGERVKSQLVTDDRIDGIEVDTGHFAGGLVSSELYTGERLDVQEQLDHLMKAKGKGRRYLNAALMGGVARADTERFISDRTVND